MGHTIFKIDDFLSKLKDCSTREDVWGETTNFYESFGFNRIIYGNLNQTGPDIITSFPQYWLEHYIDQGYSEIDPFFTYCCADYTCQKTGIAYLKNYKFMNIREQKLIKEAFEAGANAGFSVTFKASSANGAGGWNFCSSLPKDEVEKIKQEHYNLLALASFYAREFLKQKPTKDNLPPALAPREIECLLWLIEGLRTKEIAHKLNLKPVTVELYINNAKKKLKAKTREQAVAKAVLQNLITP